MTDQEMQTETKQETAAFAPPPLPSVVDNSEYFNNARNLVMQECCLDSESLQRCAVDPSTGFSYIVHLNTRGDANLVGYAPGMRRLYKHIFLQNKQFKQQVVDYYRSMGFGWVDIVTLNRVDSKIFLWPRSNN